MAVTLNGRYDEVYKFNETGVVACMEEAVEYIKEKAGRLGHQPVNVEYLRNDYRDHIFRIYWE